MSKGFPHPQGSLEQELKVTKESLQSVESELKGLREHQVAEIDAKCLEIDRMREHLEKEVKEMEGERERLQREVERWEGDREEVNTDMTRLKAEMKHMR